MTWSQLDFGLSNLHSSRSDRQAFLKIYLKPGTVCPLTDAAMASEYDLELVAEANDANWIVASSIKLLIAYSLRYPRKRFLYYSNEPRHSALMQKQYQAIPMFPAIEIMNAFTGDVFWNNFHFLGSYHFDTSNSLDIDLHRPLAPLSKAGARRRRRKTAATFFTYRPTSKSLVVDGIDRNLEVVRRTYALVLNQAGLCDIYGDGWPDGISQESSGFQSSHPSHLNWWTRKLQVLSDYRYNLCLENTAASHYCTEKLWHAIQAGTLPIYSSQNTTIFETFPEESFIDVAEFRDPGQLVECLKTMSETEYINRVNRCRETFNACIAERQKTIAHEARAHIEKLLARLN